MRRRMQQIFALVPIAPRWNLMENAEKKPKAELLMHYLSGDITKDYRNSVSYASVVFR